MVVDDVAVRAIRRARPGVRGELPGRPGNAGRSWSDRLGLMDLNRRIMDLVLGSIAFLVSLPILAAVAVWMHLSGDRGSFLYRARRVGAGGTTIDVLKIRTMREGAQGAGLTSTDDPRVTTVGRAIRRYRIDELPQLVNVVVGEMSLVGPRPEDPRYVDLGDPLHRRVFGVRPGITGPTQLQYRDEATLLAGSDDPDRLYREEILPAKLRMDAEYLDRRTIGSDLGILWQTVRVLLPGSVGRGVDPGADG